MNKAFDFFLLATTIVLVPISLLALVLIHWELTSMTFSFSPEGINTYLTKLGQYNMLFGATVAVMVAYFGLHRLNAATEANILKLKNDTFSEWKSTLEIRSFEAEKSDKVMKREFVRLRAKLYEKLYKLGFKIHNLVELKAIFEGTFQSELIAQFESQNQDYIKYGGIYPNRDTSYSFEVFAFLFFGCIDDESYSEIMIDLKKLYLSCLPEERIADGPRFTDAKLRTHLPMAV